MSDYTPTELALYEAVKKSLLSSWRNMHTNESGGFQGMLAQYVVHAITPVLAEVKAQAWEEAVNEAEACGWLHDFAHDEMLQRNPYQEGEEA